MSVRGPRARRRIAAGIVILDALVPVVSGTAVLAGSDSRAHTRGVLLFVGDSNVVLAARIGATIRSPDCVVVMGIAQITATIDARVPAN